MIERLGLSSAADLEVALQDLGTVIDWPATADLASATATRLTAGPQSAAPRSVARRPLLRSLPRALLIAATVAILVGGVAIGIRFGLDLLSIDFGPAPASPSASPRPSASGASGQTPGPNSGPGVSLGLGRTTTLADVTASSELPILVPGALGPPDAVLDGGTTLREQVAFIYAPRDDLPASALLDGAGLLVTQARGRLDEGLAFKIISSGRGTAERVTVDGAEGYWFAGEPHWFWYMAPDGTSIEDSRRLVGNTLAWQRGDVLYRIEGDIDLARALEIAASMR
jgi:hypothetical protein